MEKHDLLDVNKCFEEMITSEHDGEFIGTKLPEGFEELDELIKKVFELGYNYGCDAVRYNGV